jgi:glycine betaine/choline ABC-type transport system substrate-binding protein
VDLAKRHEVLTSGQADVSVVFTTDGQIAAVSLLVRDAALKAAGPDFQKVVQSVQEGLTTKVVQELNSRVDLDKQKPEAVAAQYLKESGYIK